MILNVRERRPLRGSLPLSSPNPTSMIGTEDSSSFRYNEKEAEI